MHFFLKEDLPVPTHSADMTGSSWAYEPEVTAMAFLLETTIACFSSNPAIPELANADHWAFYSSKPGVKTTCHRPPYVLLKKCKPVSFRACRNLCTTVSTSPPLFVNSHAQPAHFHPFEIHQGIVPKRLVARLCRQCKNVAQYQAGENNG